MGAFSRQSPPFRSFKPCYLNQPRALATQLGRRLASVLKLVYRTQIGCVGKQRAQTSRARNCLSLQYLRETSYNPGLRSQLFTTLAISQVIKMPGKTYLPIHTSMPPPRSQPVKLVSVSAVEAFLADTPFASRSITELTGGHINYVYRIHLRTPFEGSKTVVLKHAQPFWKCSVVKSWEVERQVSASEYC